MVRASRGAAKLCRGDPARGVSAKSTERKKQGYFCEQEIKKESFSSDFSAASEGAADCRERAFQPQVGKNRISSNKCAVAFSNDYDTIEASTEEEISMAVIKLGEQIAFLRKQNKMTQERSPKRSASQIRRFQSGNPRSVAPTFRSCPTLPSCSA